MAGFKALEATGTEEAMRWLRVGGGSYPVARERTFRLRPWLCQNSDDDSFLWVDRRLAWDGLLSVLIAIRRRCFHLLKDWIAEANPVRVVNAFVEALDLDRLGFAGVDGAATGRPGYHPAALLKLYDYGYLNRVPSSRRLERDAGRNVEVMWLTGQLSPDHKTIAEFRRQNGPAIGRVCTRFVAMCREMDLMTSMRVAIDGSKFKAINNLERRQAEMKLLLGTAWGLPRDLLPTLP